MPALVTFRSPVAATPRPTPTAAADSAAPTKDSPMLVLTRKSDESIRIGEDIVVKVIRTGKGTVKLGIDAPADVRVLRGELVEQMFADAAVGADADDADDDEDAFSYAGDGEFGLPASVACGGYVALPAMA